MKVLRLTSAAVVSATTDYAVRHIRFIHTGAATCTIEDGAGVERASLVTTTAKLSDDLAFSSPLMLRGLEVATISAGVLFVYID